MAEGRGQSSLHAFFKRKSLSLPSVKPPATASVEESEDDVVDLTDSPPLKKVKLTEVIPKPHVNARLSSPPSANLGPPDRSRREPAAPSTQLESYRLPRLAPPPPSQSGSAFPAYSLASHDKAVGPSSLPQRTYEQVKRHAEWQRRVLSGEIVRRRRSLALDEAAAVEARRQTGLIDDNDILEEGDTSLVDGVADVQEDTKGDKPISGIVSSLREKYSAKESSAASAKGRKKKKEEEVGPSGLTFTPLEKQYKEIKVKYPDVILMMEVGYKYKFHGEDAKNASKELGIVAFPNRNFYTASIPTYRLHIHVKKLISLGYKVGVISQTETAALKKVSDNRNAPFTRELTHLFTAATYVEDSSMSSSSVLTDDPVLPGSAPPPTNALVAIVEQGLGGLTADERVRIGLVSVVPGTGDVVWDEFDDSPVRSELETRLDHLSPAELIIPARDLSKATEKMLNHFAGISRTSVSASVRIERVDKVAKYSAALSFLSDFYNQVMNARDRRTSGDIEMIDLVSNNNEDIEDDAPDCPSTDDRDVVLADDNAQGLLAVLALVAFPKQVVVALAIAVKHLQAFKLENAFRHRSSFTRFTNRAHMLLSSNTLVNLEIYRNQTDGGVYGSLAWRWMTILTDSTKTRMGRRLMREWIGRPLLDVRALRARLDAIEEIMTNTLYHMEKLRSLLVNMPDLVRGLTRAQYGKATPSELATILTGLNRTGSEFKPNEGDIFSSSLLNNIVKTLPTIRDKAREFLGAMNTKAAFENDEANLWVDPDRYPDLQDAKDCISVCESELDQHLKDIRKILKRPTLNYVTVSGIEFLVEVPVRDSKSVPARWMKISSTKHVVRFHTPDILRITKEREQHKETLTAAGRRALAAFQADISESHELVVVAKQLAVIDCLMSLSQVAAASGYCKPEFVAEPGLHIRAGRHPMVEMLRDEAYVPFDIDFSEQDGSVKVITGPNMAGKSSCVRATALIVCMAQMGSFVPASSAVMGIHDAVQTRMGASDEISRGKSTFMVELSETSDILRTVTPRTLVILDELGRGTSTYDGVAIAHATLSHLAGIGCDTLFVTHYPTVAEELAREFPAKISNWHMAFDQVKSPVDGSAEITFLYKLSRGLAEASFGVWCARLAGLPRSVLDNAQARADQLKRENESRRFLSLVRRFRQLYTDISTSSTTDPIEIIQNANTLYKALVNSRD
ncbi:DNA mismatch repair protein MSH3 [Tremella mesenterica]|uniref:DNA mismatch repair protein MSH3 n=1 Tax=Tremella mesenterica TaxID=5217 RepID=A0A4Q1BR50_TREME|nr:DNA mismatch repair protein MSH3 [Tremella mesenterica]